MHIRPRHTGLAVVLAAAVAAVAATAGQGADGVISGLNSPRGISTAAGKALVAESGDGTVAQLRGGKNQASALATLPNVVDVALTGNGWEAYAITGGPPPESGGPPPPTASKLWHITSSGKVELVADIGAFQQTDPDPEDQDDPPNPTESNPNGLALLPGGGILVSDAAGFSEKRGAFGSFQVPVEMAREESRDRVRTEGQGGEEQDQDRLPARPPLLLADGEGEDEVDEEGDPVDRAHHLDEIGAGEAVLDDDEGQEDQVGDGFDQGDGAELGGHRGRV